MLGRFLEVSVAATDVSASLAFYESLGFVQAAVGDAWSHPYAVVTDGRLHLGLHDTALESPTLTWVQPGLAAHAPLLQALGIDFEFAGLDEDATILRLDSRKKDTWTVSSLTPTGAGKSCEWVTKDLPIFMDPSQNLVLGVTAGDGTACMPLDVALSWIDLTEVERTQLREQLGPERLPPGAISTVAPSRTTLARLAPRLAVLGLVFATVAGTAAWLAFGDEPTGRAAPEFSRWASSGTG